MAYGGGASVFSRIARAAICGSVSNGSANAMRHEAVVSFKIMNSV